MTVYFFWGQEEYDIEKEVASIKDKYLDDAFSSMNLRYFYAPEFKELMNVLCTTGTMFGNIVNIIKTDGYLFDRDKNLSDEQLAEIKKVLDTSSDNVHTIFTLTIPREYSTKDANKIANKELVKILTKKAQTKACNQYPSYSKDLFNRIIKLGKEKNLFISTDIAKYIVEKLGVNLKIIDTELDKLQIAIYPDTKVSKENINSNLNFNEDIFKITNYLFEGKKDLALWEFRKNCDNGKHHLEVLAFLQNRISQCISIKTDIENMPLAEVARKNIIGEYPAKLLLQTMSNLSVSNLVNLKKNLIKAEEAIKTDYSLSGELEIEKAILSDF